MSHSKFGWSYPPGCDGPPDSGDETCAVCGVDAGSCQCPVCPVCGVQGDPACYTEHGLKHPADEPLTPDEAQRAYDEAPAVPLSDERIKEIVDYATGPTGRVPEQPLHFTEDDVKRVSGD